MSDSFEQHSSPRSPQTILIHPSSKLQIWNGMFTVSLLLRPLQGAEPTMSTDTMRPVRSREKALRGFRVHLALYVALNIMLLGFNVLTGAPWWSVWILCAWGVVVVAHGVAALLAGSSSP